MSDTSLAPSGWTSGTRIKAAQYCSCQKRGPAWHPFPGHPGNDPAPEAGCAKPSRDSHLWGGPPGESPHEVRDVGMRWGLHHSPQPSPAVGASLMTGGPLSCVVRGFLTWPQRDKAEGGQGTPTELLQHACPSESHCNCESERCLQCIEGETEPRRLGGLLKATKGGRGSARGKVLAFGFEASAPSASPLGLMSGLKLPDGPGPADLSPQT